MITELTDLPDGVIGFEAFGRLEADDYRDVLLPAVEQAATGGDVRIVIVIERMSNMIAIFGWMTPGEVKHFPLGERDAAIAWAAG